MAFADANSPLIDRSRHLGGNYAQYSRVPWKTLIILNTLISLEGKLDAYSKHVEYAPREYYHKIFINS